MELTGHQLIAAPRQRVWDALMDLDTLKAAIPGGESIEDLGGGQLGVQVVAAIGPVKARFKGRLQQQALQAPDSYTLAFEGEGGVAGFARGSAEVRLSDAGDAGRARLDYSATARIGGRLAQIGSRLVDASAARLSAQFFERLQQAIGGQLPAAAGRARPAAAHAPAEATQPAPHVPVAGAEQDLPAARGAMVTLQMPAWTWAFTVAVLALVAGWLGTR